MAHKMAIDYGSAPRILAYYYVRACSTDYAGNSLSMYLGKCEC